MAKGVGACVEGGIVVGIAVDMAGGNVVNIVGSTVGTCVGAYVGVFVVREGAVVGASDDGASVGMLDVGATVGACDGQSLVPWKSALVDIHGTICTRLRQLEI
jgi:hypothetical protein